MTGPETPPSSGRAQLREVFEGIYAGTEWGGGSGPGSNATAAADYRTFLERFLARNPVHSVVDVGCGDWQFSRFVNFGHAAYHGVEVVPSLVERNTAAFGGERVRFSLAPQDPRDLPRADLLLMKDVLQHLPDAEVTFYRDHVVPRYRFALLTNSFQKIGTPHNVDISTGQFRTLDLAAEPYRFRGAYVAEFWTDVWERIQTFLVIR